MADPKVLKKLWFAYISGLIMWVGASYFSTVQTYFQGELLAYVHENNVYTADFLLYYNDAILSWECLKGEKIDIWDPQLQNTYLQKLVPHITLTKIFYSQYPPYLMVLVMPLALVSLKTAFALWELLGLAGIIFSIYSLLSTTLKGKFERAFAYIAVLASFPAWLCFRLGQIGFAIYPALTWYWIALDRKYWFRAGMLGGWCLLKLQYAPVLFITGCLLGGVRFAAGYAVMGLIYLLASIAVLGFENVKNYPEALKMGEISGGQITGVSPETQQNLRGQLVVLLGNDGHLVHLIVVAVWGIATLFTAYLWWQYKRKTAQDNEIERRRKFLILASITLLLQLVTSPHTHKQDYLFVSLPAIWLFYSVVGNYPVGDPAMPGVKNKALILIIRYMLLSFPVASWIFFDAAYYFQAFLFPLPIQLFFVWAVILLVVLFLLLHDTRKA